MGTVKTEPTLAPDKLATVVAALEKICGKDDVSATQAERYAYATDSSIHRAIRPCSPSS